MCVCVCVCIYIQWECLLFFWREEPSSRGGGSVRNILEKLNVQYTCILIWEYLCRITKRDNRICNMKKISHPIPKKLDASVFRRWPHPTSILVSFSHIYISLSILKHPTVAPSPETIPTSKLSYPTGITRFRSHYCCISYS